MTSTEYLNRALHHTASDLRDVHNAARADLQRLTKDALIIAEERVLKPAKAAVHEASDVIEKRAKDLAKYAAAYPAAALAGAALGGFFLGRLMRRR